MKVRFPRSDIDGIDAFAASEPDQPTRTEALRRIVSDWLLHHGYLPGGGGTLRSRLKDNTLHSPQKTKDF